MEKSDKARMHMLLEEMLKSAEERDGQEVLGLNKSIEPLIIEEQKSSNSQLGIDYDNCRQSCVLSFTRFSGSYDKLIADARSRFSEIQKSYG